MEALGHAPLTINLQVSITLLSLVSKHCGGSGKSSVFNGGVIIPFPIVGKSASGSQGGDALVQQNAGNSDIVNSQANNALSFGVGGTPQYICGDLWEVGTNL